MNLEESFYLSDNRNVSKALDMTGLSFDELRDLVGLFRPNSIRAGQLRGEVVINYDGSVIIRHHFNKKVLWEG